MEAVNLVICHIFPNVRLMKLIGSLLMPKKLMLSFKTASELLIDNFHDKNMNYRFNKLFH